MSRVAVWRRLDRELAGAAFGLTLVASGVYGQHVIDGGFISDDWLNAQLARFAPTEGVLGAIAWQLEGNLSYRPGLASYLGATYELFGVHSGPHLAGAVALATASVWVMYALSRVLGLAVLPAALAAVLTLVFPWADSTRLWATGGANNLAVLLWALGSLVAVRATSPGASRVGARLALGTILILAGVLVYELVGPAGIVTGVLVAVRLGGRWGAAWGAGIAGACVAALAYVAHFTNRPAAPFDAQVDHAEVIARQAWDIGVEAFGPFAPGSLPVSLGVCVAVVAAWRFARPAARYEARQYGLIAVGTLPALVVAYALIVPAAPNFYNPAGAGQVNRVNILAAPVFSLGVVSSLGLLATLAAGWHRRWRLIAGGLTVLATVVVTIGYVDRVREDARGWQLGGKLALGVVTKVKQSIAKPVERSTVFTFGHVIDAAPGVPVFSAVWDLDGALRLAFDDRTLHAYAVLPDTVWQCGESAVNAAHPVYGVLPDVPHGRAIFVDVASGAHTVIADRRTCEDAVARFSPIPVPPLPDELR